MFCSRAVDCSSSLVFAASSLTFNPSPGWPSRSSSTCSAPHALGFSFRDSRFSSAASNEAPLLRFALPFIGLPLACLLPAGLQPHLRPPGTTRRGHVPPSQFLTALAAFSKRGSQVCCTLQPIMGSAAFQGSPASNCKQPDTFHLPPQQRGHPSESSLRR